LDGVPLNGLGPKCKLPEVISDVPSFVFFQPKATPAAH
jgi:hypothetical protein